jgi:hypothetical protein
LYTGLDGLAPYNVFPWSLTHQHAVIDGHLATYRGIFVGDACGANARLQQRSGGRILHANCNLHARREFIQAEADDPVLASQAISFYHRLYAVEERGKTLDAAARHPLRQRDAVPIWNRMRHWLEREPVKRALPRSRIGEALGYLRNQWSALTVYLGDGRLPSDNAQSEQTLRPLTVGRNNWQFLGHPKAAAGRLQLYRVISSAHRHHLVLDDSLEDVLRKLADAQQNHPADLAPSAPYLLDLLPDRWALAHPRSLRQGRIEDRQTASDAKRWRRARARVQARTAKAARWPPASFPPSPLRFGPCRLHSCAMPESDALALATSAAASWFCLLVAAISFAVGWRGPLPLSRGAQAVSERDARREDRRAQAARPTYSLRPAAAAGR